MKRKRRDSETRVVNPNVDLIICSSPIPPYRCMHGLHLSPSSNIPFSVSIFLGVFPTGTEGPICPSAYIHSKLKSKPATPKT